MSTVTPSDWNNVNQIVQDNRRAMNQAEEDHQRELEQVKEDRDAELQRARDKQKKELKRREEIAAEANRNAKEKLKENIIHERKRAQAEVEDLKSQLYGKDGKTQRDELQKTRRQALSSQENFEREMESQKAQTEELRKNYDERLKTQAESYEQKIENDVNRARESANAAYHEAYESDKEDASGVKTKQEEEYAALIKRLLEDAKIERNLTKHYMDEADAKVKKAEGLADRKLAGNKDRAADAYRKLAEEQVMTLKKSHEGEVKNLRDVVKGISNQKYEFDQGRAEGKQAAIGEMESDWRTRNKVLVDNYESSMKKTEELNQTAQDKLMEKNQEVIRDRDAKTATLVGNEVLQRHQLQKDMEQSHLKDREYLLDQMRKQQVQNELSFEQQTQRMQELSEEALKQQGETFRETNEVQKTDLRDRISYLEEQLLDHQTKSDPALVAPAAEERLRKSYVDQANAQLKEETNRNNRAMESYRSDMSQALKTSEEQRVQDLQQLKRSSTSQLDDERSQFNRFITDSKFLEDEHIKSQEFTHSRELEKTDKRYSQLLEDQRRKYEDLLQGSQVSAENRLREHRQMTEFEKNLLHRQHTSDQYQMIREFETKLADQKEEYELKLKEQKDMSEKQVLESDREKKHTLEEQKILFEGRMAQMEQQYTEKERQIIENYERQLENVRRANARLVQTKS